MPPLPAKVNRYFSAERRKKWSNHKSNLVFLYDPWPFVWIENCLLKGNFIYCAKPNADCTDM